MATTKKEELRDETTVVTEVKEQTTTVPRVQIYLPPLDNEEGMKVDQYEHVTINGETTLVKRGQHVEVTVPVYLQLRNKFPYV